MTPPRVSRASIDPRSGVGMVEHRFPTGPGRGIDQGGPRLRRYSIDVSSLRRHVKFELPAGTVALYVERNPFAVGEAFIFFGRPQGDALSGAALTGDVVEGIDLTAFRTIGCAGYDEFYLYTTQTYASPKLSLIAFVGNAWVEPARDLVTIGGQPLAMNLTQINGSSNETTMAPLPTVRVNPFGNVGGTVAANAPDHFATACANAANTLVRAGQALGVNYCGVMVSTAAIALAFLRRNTDNTASGIVVSTTLRAPDLLAGGTSLYCVQNSGGPINVAGFLYVNMV